MKQLFNYGNGRALGVAFTDDSTDFEILLWVEDNLDSLEEIEIGDDSADCELSIEVDGRLIEVRGDNTLAFIKIKDLELINLNK